MTRMRWQHRGWRLHARRCSESRKQIKERERNVNAPSAHMNAAYRRDAQRHGGISSADILMRITS